MSNSNVMNRTGSPYRQLFRIPGAAAFCISGAFARLPISMMSLGIVLALNHLYDNWTVAGTMSAVYILAAAVVTPFYARLFDRFGQGKVGSKALVTQVVSMFAFAFAALGRVPIPLLFVLAVIMGLTQFSFGALVRTRWAHALSGAGNDALLNTAYALEAGIDEMVFILGPILAAFLATSVHPVSQLFVPTFACAIGGSVFFSLKNTQPPVIQEVSVNPVSAMDSDVRQAIDNAGNSFTTDPTIPSPQSKDATVDRLSLRQLHRRRDRTRSVLLYPGIVPLLIVFIVFNMSFTAFDVSVTDMMKTINREELLGMQLSLVALGSCIGAFIFGSRQHKGSNWVHMVSFLCLLTTGDVVLRLTMDNLLLMGVFEVFTGLCVSPLFATGNLIVKDIVPARSLTEGLSWVATAGSVGASFGSTLAGVVLDFTSPHIGLMLPWMCTLCAIPLALLGWFLARRRTRVAY